MVPGAEDESRSPWRISTLTACLFSVCALAAPQRAAAQTPVDPGTATTPPARPGDARGLEERPRIEAEDVGLFLPRAILYVPARIVGMVSFPLREGLRFVERHHVIERVEDFLYNDERTAAVIPLISASTFFGAQFGVRAFHDDLGGHGEEGSIKASVGADGSQVYVLSFRANHTAGTRLFVESTTSYEQHPGLRFYGIGNTEVTRDGVGQDPRETSRETYFGVRRFRQITAVGATLGPPRTEFRIAGRGRLKRHDFQAPTGLAEDEQALSNVYDVSALPGYEQGSTVLETELFASLDTRNRNGATSRGFYGELFAGGALPIGEFEYFHMGLEGTGYIDLFHDDRVLVLRGAYEGMEGASEKIPFVELPSLGGPHRLRGYDLGRFRDEHSLVATVEYHYPIHQYLAGAFFVDVGEVSKSFEGLFTDPHAHVGGGGELILRSQNNVLFTVGIAGGGGVQVYATTDPLRAFADRDGEL